MQQIAPPTDLVTTIIPLAIAVPWAILWAGLHVSNRGRRYLNKSLGDRQAADNMSSQPNAIAIAGLVFAGMAFVVGSRSTAILEPLLLSVCCFVTLYATGFWPWSKRLTILGDGLQWTGLSLFLAGTYLFALNETPSVLPVWAIAAASLLIALLSSITIYSRIRSTKDTDKPLPTEEP